MTLLTAGQRIGRCAAVNSLTRDVSTLRLQNIHLTTQLNVSGNASIAIRSIAAIRAYAFRVFETDDAAALAKLSMQWDDLIDGEVIPVLTDAELAKAF